ncbi:MAG: hypothetical protein A2293_00460 [Elusimicrobia bacterium RIFOXYB2_FULL_49_7]|nr:MAG: hypothetical protein A2293_00460 [Elusimicrobia bacterium RIFOXYB2_FULL_49_7]
MPLGRSEEKSLEEALFGSETLRVKREQMVALRHQVAASRPGSFGPGFSNRVMQTLLEQRAGFSNVIAVSFTARLVAAFKPLAIASAAAILLLALVNIMPVEKTADGSLSSNTVQTVDDFIDQTFVLHLEDIL